MRSARPAGPPRASRRALPAAIGLALSLGAAAPWAGCGESRPADWYETPAPRESARVQASLHPAPGADFGSFEPSPADAAAHAQPADAEPMSSGPADAAPAPAAADPTLVPSFVALFKRLSPSVVNVYTQEVIHERIADPFAPLAPADALGTSLGSGAVLDRDGHIITNAHVVENAAEIRVRFHDDRELPARLVGIDPVRDLALLKVDGASALLPVVPAEPYALEVGDWVIAIGNPFGLSHTLTKGIVSATGRAELINARTGYHDLIQTDAAINEGNSGGPLFDMRGHIVGLNTAVSAEGQGIGFAIPWPIVRDALPRLKQGGQVSRSWLGVFVRPAEEFAGAPGGVVVSGVVDDSPAALGGLRAGDVIVSLDGRAVRSVAEFRLQVAAGVTGRDMPVDVARAGHRLQLIIRLEEARDVR